MTCVVAYFWPRLIFWCHFLQTLVGANIRPERHWLPNAAWPARWVPPPETRGIRATARPVQWRLVFRCQMVQWCPDSTRHTSTPWLCRCLFTSFFAHSIRLPFVLCDTGMNLPIWCLWAEHKEESSTISLLDDIGTDWRRKNGGERVSFPAGLAIRRGNGDCGTRRHCCR